MEKLSNRTTSVGIPIFKPLSISIFLCVVLIESHIARADTSLDFNILGSVGMTYKNYEYNIESNSLSGKYFSDSLPSIKYQVGFASENYNLAFFGDNTIDLGGATSVNPLFSSNTTAKLSRDDYAIQGTMNLNENWSAGGGYRWMQTLVDYSASENSERDHIETYGPYVSLSYWKAYNDKSNYQISFLLNSLSTDFTLSSTNQNYKFNFDGYGYGFSLAWGHSLSNTSSLKLSTELHKYHHKDMKNSNVPTEDFSLKESTVATRMEYIKKLK